MIAIAGLYPSLQYGIEYLYLEFLVEHRTVSIVVLVEDTTLCMHMFITTTAYQNIVKG